MTDDRDSPDHPLARATLAIVRAIMETAKGLPVSVRREPCVVAFHDVARNRIDIGIEWPPAHEKDPAR